MDCVLTSMFLKNSVDVQSAFRWIPFIYRKSLDSSNFPVGLGVLLSLTSCILLAKLMDLSRLDSSSLKWGL